MIFGSIYHQSYCCVICTVLWGGPHVTKASRVDNAITSVLFTVHPVQSSRCDSVSSRQLAKKITNADRVVLTHNSKLGTYLTITKSRSTNDNSMESIL